MDHLVRCDLRQKRLEMPCCGTSPEFGAPEVVVDLVADHFDLIHVQLGALCDVVVGVCHLSVPSSMQHVGLAQFQSCICNLRTEFSV